MNRFKAFSIFRTLFFFGLLLLVWAEVYGGNESSGIKYYRNFSSADYDHQEQNWSVLQDKRGVIYVGNQGALMEFDGLSWRLIYIPNLTVRSLALDEKNTIYVGGENEIGFLALANGTRQYVSLMNYLKDDEKNFGKVWRTHSTSEGIFFRSSKLLFCCDPKAKTKAQAIKIFRTEKIFNGSFVCQGKLFIRKEGIGLMQVVRDSLVLIPGGEIFADKKVYMMVPYDAESRRILIGTRARGFYRYDGKKVVPFPTQVDHYLTEKRVYHGIRLSSRTGEFALATRRGGLVVMDSRGKLTYQFTKADGLLDNNVKYVFEDSQGNLWLALNKGLSKIEYHSPISIYDDRSSLPGIVVSVSKHKYEANDVLYAGTTDGLYVLSPGTNKFRPVPGISSGCWAFISVDGSVLAATSAGVFQIRRDLHHKIIKDTSYALLQSEQDPNRIWVGTSMGLAVLYRNNNQWLLEHRFEHIHREIKTIAEDPKGNLWLGLAKKGILKIDFPAEDTILQPVVTRYDISHQHQNKEIKVFKAAGHVIFATRGGIFRFHEAKKMFLPDNTLGNRFAGGSSGSEPVFHIAEDKNKHIWFHSAAVNFQAVPETNGTFKIDSTPFRRIPLAQVNFIYPDPDGVILWFASNNGLIRYDKTVGKEKNYQFDFSTLIREVWVNGTPLMYDRENFRYRINKLTPASPLPIIDYKNRNLRFEYAAPFFEAESEIQYRFRLEGHDKNWSVWSSELYKDYTNLDDGKYRFRVQARNVYHHTGGEAVFQFKVLPPWYKSWWAYSLYGVAAVLLMFLVVRWRSGKLQREKQKLEKIVKERTREINRKNLQLEKQTVQLKEQSEELKEMDRVKSRFFANISHEFRTPLTLIMGPLDRMISASSDDRQKKDMNVMLRNSQRLLTLINQLLDLSRFDSGKMRLQASQQDIISFLKGITASFEILARQNKLELTFITEEENILLYFDPGKLEEVFSNLLLNAVKFTPPGGKITVSLKCINAGSNDKGSSTDPGFVEISVRDTGIGISKDQLIHIFDRFYQAERSPHLKHDQKGTGIGLALTQEIVTLHHGKIDVHSREGEGTEFIIRFPLGHGHLKPEEITGPAKTEGVIRKAAQLADHYLVKEEEKEPIIEEAEGTAEEKPMILIVEDNDEMRKYIREPLESFYRVVEAEDGKEGIKKARELIPDLIISDIMMPEMDGYQLCGALKKDINTSHVPIIMLTAKASEQSIVQGLETGADDYITKPFNTKILMTRIKNLIELRRQLQLKIQRRKMLLPAEISVSSLDDKFLEEFQEIIEQNLTDPEFNIETLCKKLYMGRTTLFRKVQALTGETPNQFVQSYRLERAAQLLKANFGNITEVAFEVGFSNSAYFTKCFKEKFHQLPSTFQASEAQSPKNNL